MIIKVEVTQRHINSGLKRDCNKCPVALVLKEIFPNASRIIVGGFAIDMYALGEEYFHNFPDSVGNFTLAFDDGKEVEPFAFEIDVPDRFIEKARYEQAESEK